MNKDFIPYIIAGIVVIADFIGIYLLDYYLKK